MNKEDILNYVGNTPENTNLNILSSMLDSYGGGGDDTLIVTLSENDGVYSIDKTFDELVAAYPNILFNYAEPDNEEEGAFNGYTALHPFEATVYGQDSDYINATCLWATYSGGSLRTPTVYYLSVERSGDIYYAHKALATS